MKGYPLELPEVVLLEPRVFKDERGWFFESFSQPAFEALVGSGLSFVQDNHSCSEAGVLRGLHYQLPPKAQGKLVRVVAGAVFDVAVDVRRRSSTFGAWVAAELTAQGRQQLWVPPGFAHGFLSLSERTEVLYKTTNVYAPEQERAIAWDDPAIGIHWPTVPDGPRLSPKDAEAPSLACAEVF
ncbi:dTDP-4-dehydrorhamnose 3,5-epimerase [Aquisalimonas sp. APHAB1-3]|uniref:dTDP-4-dehydrorhamnose 3,5-epimerase n=1 Tax=Aquisalimonas sp. APHAB1-3 TaxID=3402080 RepID=UPI003AB0E71D